MLIERDLRLLRRFTENGDAEAFGQLIHLYTGLVYGTCLRITGNPNEAADAAQDTFFHLARNAARITGSITGWLHQVATRRAIDLVRTNRARRQREQVYANQPLVETDRWADVSPLLDEAMGELDETSRDVLIRHFLQGETTVRIAALEGVAQSTVSRRIEKALGEVRERLRAKGMLLATVTLSTFMSQAAQTAPAPLVAELGKIVLTISASAGANAGGALSTGFGLKVAVATAVGVLGLGGYLAYQIHRSARPPSRSATMEQPVVGPASTAELNAPPAATPELTAGQKSSIAKADALLVGGMGIGGAPPAELPPAAVPTVHGGQDPAAGGMAFGGRGAPLGTATAPGRASPEGTFVHFISSLARSDLEQARSCLALGLPEADHLSSLLESPESDEERELGGLLASLAHSLEVLEATPMDMGLQVRYRVRLRMPLTIAGQTRTRTWQADEQVELTIRMREVGTQWRILSATK